MRKNIILLILLAMAGTLFFVAGIVVCSIKCVLVGILLSTPCFWGLCGGNSHNYHYHNSCYDQKDPDYYLNNYSSLEWWDASKNYPTDLFADHHKK